MPLCCKAGQPRWESLSFCLRKYRQRRSGIKLFMALLLLVLVVFLAAVQSSLLFLRDYQVFDETMRSQMLAGSRQPAQASFWNAYLIIKMSLLFIFGLFYFLVPWFCLSPWPQAQSSREPVSAA